MACARPSGGPGSNANCCNGMTSSSVPNFPDGVLASDGEKRLVVQELIDSKRRWRRKKDKTVE
jgi:hypothetical protein